MGHVRGAIAFLVAWFGMVWLFDSGHRILFWLGVIALAAIPIASFIIDRRMMRRAVQRDIRERIAASSAQYSRLTSGNPDA